MLEQKFNPAAFKSARLFYVGLALVLLVNWLPFIPAWYTFIHMWRVEIASSVFLSAVLIYLLLNGKKFSLRYEIHPDEWKFVILPILAFIVWSFLSTLWAPSWKSAIHHSLVWSEYLMFYLIFRQMLRRGARFRTLLALLVLTLVLYAVPAIVEYCAFLSFGGTTTLGMRYAKFGEQIVTLLPLVLLAVVRTRGRQFVIGAAAVAAVWLLIFCSFGRINYLLFGCVIVGMLGLLSISKQHRRYLPRFGLLVVVLVLVPLPLQLFSMSSSESSIPVLNRLNDSEGLSSSNNFRKLMYSVAGEMIRANPLIGVGADNFGMQVNHYREIYGAGNPDEVNLVNAEDQIPSHAHNEFLQIVAELGVVGGAIFAWLLVGMAVMAFRAIRRIGSGQLDAAAAVLGLGMFLISSLVSAYSFRVMQNGIVFFFVLAFAVVKIFQSHRSSEPETRVTIAPRQARFAFAFGIVICVGLTIYSSVRVSSVIITTRANQTETLLAAMPLYELAMRLDDENPDVRANLGMRLFRSRRYEESIPYLQSAISIGRAPSSELSYLATAKALAGDDQGAEETMATAASLYPRSPFVLTRYAMVMEKNGRTAESADIFSRATKLDERAANTWRALIVSGPKAVSDMAARDSAYLPVMELRPESSIYAVVTERFIRFPEERRFSFSKTAFDKD